jgi:hypothetical protein
MDVLDLITKIGSLAGYLASGFIVYDRFFKGEPLVYLQPGDTQLAVVVRNVAKEPILIKSFKCRPEAMFVSLSAEVGDLVYAIRGKPINALIQPDGEHHFVWADKDEWAALAPNHRALIKMHWTFTRSRWLPRSPVRIRNTVGGLNELRTLIRFGNRPVVE